VPVQRQQALFFQLGAHDLGRVAIDHHLDAHFEKRDLGVVAVERQKTVFARDARDFENLFDQGVGGGQLELESLDGNLEGPKNCCRLNLDSTTNTLPPITISTEAGSRKPPGSAPKMMAAITMAIAPMSPMSPMRVARSKA